MNTSDIQEKALPVTYVPAGTGRKYRSPVDDVTFVITGEQSGGALFMADVMVPPGGGNPPHIHAREEESFYVKEGKLTVHVGGKTVEASAGDYVCLPRGITHSFQNTGDVPAKFLLVVTPAGLEKFFEEGFYPVTDPSEPRPPMDEAFMGRIMAAAAKVGLEFLPPPQH